MQKKNNKIMTKLANFTRLSYRIAKNNKKKNEISLQFSLFLSIANRIPNSNFLHFFLPFELIDFS